MMPINRKDLAIGLIICVFLFPSSNGEDGIDASKFVPPFSPIRRSTDGKQGDKGMVEALKRAGHFNMAAAFLGSLDLSHLLPESSTLFVPWDNKVTASGIQVSSFNAALPILQYHVVTRQLSFHDLQELPVGATLETMLSNRTVLVTNNSAMNFTVDDVPLSHPDLYLADSMVIHGIGGVLNASVYGQKRLDPKSTGPPSGQSDTSSPSPSTSQAPSIVTPSPVNHAPQPALRPSTSPPPVSASNKSPDSQPTSSEGVFSSGSTISTSGPMVHLMIATVFLQKFLLLF